MTGDETELKSCAARFDSARAGSVQSTSRLYRNFHLSIARRVGGWLERLVRLRFFPFGMLVMEEVGQDSAAVFLCRRSEEDSLLNGALSTEAAALGNVNLVFNGKASLCIASIVDCAVADTADRLGKKEDVPHPDILFGPLRQQKAFRLHETDHGVFTGRESAEIPLQPRKSFVLLFDREVAAGVDGHAVRRLQRLRRHRRGRRFNKPDVVAAAPVAPKPDEGGEKNKTKPCREEMTGYQPESAERANEQKQAVYPADDRRAGQHHAVEVIDQTGHDLVCDCG